MAAIATRNLRGAGSQERSGFDNGRSGIQMYLQIFLSESHKEEDRNKAVNARDIQ